MKIIAPIPALALWTRLLAFAILLSSFAGCAKPEPVLVVTVGGLGFSQMGDLRHAVERQCPHAKVISAGAWDAYKADIKGIATAKPHQRIILVGHSFGCRAIAQAAAELPKVDLAVFIDPSWDDFHLPRNVSNYLWYKRSGLGFEREARIVGAAKPKTIEGGHNNIPHSPELIAAVVNAINNIKPEDTAPPLADARPKSPDPITAPPTADRRPRTVHANTPQSLDPPTANPLASY